MIKISLYHQYFLLPLIVALLSASSRADTSLDSFLQDCRELSAGKQGENSAAAKLIISSWLKGLKAAAFFNGESGTLTSIFADAEDPGWCAASLEKFLLENRDSLPDGLSAEDALPLWWMSVHPGADPKHKEMLRCRLLALKEEKKQSEPRRRFPAKTG